MDVTDYPPLFVAADAASGWGQRWHRRIVGSNLILVIVSSTLGYIATAGGETLRIASSVLSALALIAGLASRWQHHLLRDERRWFEGRAVAETAKSLTWRYIMRVPPFADGAGTDADIAFISALGEVNTEIPVADLADVGAIGVQQITPRMREIRALDVDDRRAIYASDRLGDQVRWYASKTEWNKRRSTLWSRVALTSEMLAIISALAVIVSPNPWLNVVTLLGAVSASATAWSKLGQHSELSISYNVAARELAKLRDLAAAASSEAELSAIVLSGEGAISREHTLWIAKRGNTLTPAI